MSNKKKDLYTVEIVRKDISLRRIFVTVPGLSSNEAGLTALKKATNKGDRAFYWKDDIVPDIEVDFFIGSITLKDPPSEDPEEPLQYPTHVTSLVTCSTCKRIRNTVYIYRCGVKRCDECRDKYEGVETLKSK